MLIYNLRQVEVTPVVEDEKPADKAKLHERPSSPLTAIFWIVLVLIIIGVIAYNTYQDQQKRGAVTLLTSNAASPKMTELTGTQRGGRSGSSKV